MSCTAPTLDVATLTRNLMRPVGGFRRVAVRVETGSTNADLAELASAHPAQWPDASVLIADSQIAGKGRLGRVWEVPAGAAMISSVLLRPSETAAEMATESKAETAAELPAQAGKPTMVPTQVPAFSSSGYGWLSVLAGVALCQAIAAESEVPAVLKWPNDVLVNGRKLAGILAQVVRSPARGDLATEQQLAIVVGAGVNISQARGELPADRATSLFLEGGTQLDRNVLLPAYLNRFIDLYRAFVASGADVYRPIMEGESLHALASGLMSTLGSEVRAELPGGGMLFGTAVRLDNGGELVIRESNGSLHSVSAADVIHLRRTGLDGEAFYA